MKDEALKLALEALEANQPVNYCVNSKGEKFPMSVADPFKFQRCAEAITAIKEALAQPAPVQEPMHPELRKMWEHYFDKCFRDMSLLQRESEEDDDTQGFEPDWANFQEGRALGWTEAFERIVDKVKSMPWESDTRDSFLIWLKEQR